MSASWIATQYPGACTNSACSKPIVKGDPVVLGEVEGKRKPIRCQNCPDLDPADKAAAERARARGAQKEAHRQQDDERRGAPATTSDELTRRCGTLVSASPSIADSDSIRRYLAAHGLSVRDLVSAFGVLAASSSTLAECSVESWIAAADSCARWGLLPRIGPASPVYLVPRDGQVRAEKTSAGDLEILRRAGVCSDFAGGWTFACESRLGELAARCRDPETRAAAREEAEALRADLTRRAATMLPEERDALPILGWYLQTPVAKLTEREDRGAIARLGRAIKDLGDGVSEEARAVLDLLRRLLASPPPPASDLTPEDRKALDTYRLSLEERSSGLNADEEALLAGLRLPRWEQWGWYHRPLPPRRPGETEDAWRARPRLLVFDLPDPSLWARPAMDYRRTTPVIWWVRLRGYRDLTTELSEPTELAHVLDREQVYARALSGRTVQLDPRGMLMLRGNDSPWCGPYHGEMGLSKVLKNAVSRGVVALSEALRATLGPIVEYDQPNEAPVSGLRGVLDRARPQLEQSAHVPDLAEQLAAERARETAPAREAA